MLGKMFTGSMDEDLEYRDLWEKGLIYIYIYICLRVRVRVYSQMQCVFGKATSLTDCRS